MRTTWEGYGHIYLHDVLYKTNLKLLICQNKKRKYGRDRDDDDVGRQKTPEEPEDPLKDAATLYVGNLYAKALRLSPQDLA